MCKIKTKRDWGYFFTLLSFSNLKLKLLQVSKNKAIHLQYHSYRSELWFVLAGKGLVQVGRNRRVIKPGSYVHISKGVLHKIWALTAKLSVVEVQLGSKVIEDDIVHLD